MLLLDPWSQHEKGYKTFTIHKAKAIRFISSCIILWLSVLEVLIWLINSLHFVFYDDLSRSHFRRKLILFQFLDELSLVSENNRFIIKKASIVLTQHEPSPITINHCKYLINACLTVCYECCVGCARCHKLRFKCRLLSGGLVEPA